MRRPQLQERISWNLDEWSDDATDQLLMCCTTEPDLLAPRAALVCNDSAYYAFLER